MKIENNVFQGSQREEKKSFKFRLERKETGGSNMIWMTLKKITKKKTVEKERVGWIVEREKEYPLMKGRGRRK